MSEREKSPDEVLRDLVNKNDPANALPTDPSQQFPYENPKGPKAVYTEYDHKRAYEIWRTSENFAEVARQMQIHPHTIRQWARPGYRCKLHCQWHDWKALKRSEFLAGNSLVHIDERIRENILSSYEQEELDPYALTRRDEERLIQLELMYVRAYYAATGQMLDFEDFSSGGGLLDKEDLLQMFDKATAFRSAEAAVKATVAVLREIEALKDKLGLNKKKDLTADKVSGKDLPDFTPEELRNMKELLERATPDEKKLLNKLFVSKNNALAAMRRMAEADDDVEDGDEADA